MSLNLLFWVLYIVSLVFGIVTTPKPFNFVGFGSTMLFYILIGLLGWATFGAAIHR